MAKNFKAIYEGGNDASALNQTFFLKKETIRGVTVAPAGTDFLYTMSGGSVNFSQPFEVSPHKTGRHANNIILQKTSTEWSLSTLFNIAQSNPPLFAACIDAPIKMLWEAVLGKAYPVPGTEMKFDPSTDPTITFTMMENGDHLAKQAAGCYVNQVEVQMPGDGMTQMDWSGNAKTVYHAGIGKSTISNNGGSTVSIQAGEGRRFDIGAMVMIVKADGVTRSADTATPRKITNVVIGNGVAATATVGVNTFTAVNVGAGGNAIALVFDGTDDVTTVVTAWNTANPTNQVGFTGAGGTVLTAQTVTLSGGSGSAVDVVTLDGANLADADGSAANTPIFLCYWEPLASTIAGIDEPQTGLKGKITINTLPTLSCVRGATLSINNNHELVDYCYGTDGAGGSIFVPSSRLEATLSIELNLNAPLVEFFKRVREFEAHDVTLICGNSDKADARFVEFKCPKVKFNVPSIEIPESGAVPVSFEGTCLQTALEQGDEVQVFYKEV